MNILKNFKRITFTLLVVLLASFAINEVYSHGRGSGYDRSNEYTQRYHGCGYGYSGFHKLEILKDELVLTDEQMEKIFNVNTKFREKYFENKGDYDRIREIRIEHRKAIEKVLTKEQKEKFNSTRWHSGHHYWK